VEPRVEIDGRTAGPADALTLMGVGYGHFTAMQVRDRKVRGLDLHLSRLDHASREIFGRPLDGDLVRQRIRHALDEVRDASVRVFVAEEALIVTVRGPGDPPPSPQRLRSVRYQRPLAHLKHSSGFAQTYHREAALREGYDEILLTTDDGTVSEGAITNLAGWDGTALIWPDAPHLAGITMQLLQRSGIPSRYASINLAGLKEFTTVIVTNARGVAVVASVDDVPMNTDETVAEMVRKTYAEVPGDPI
jgi:branched-subunit amino acid aminotransferase/4-amino-4-deoxychorismate lyase